mmetsp:Transcript_4335/g.10645  ORF Transcript_4335/g.10645 Transcript_4335/m.10645 type:complete len:347 (+) Transcript_4335:47-1087(+)
MAYCAYDRHGGLTIKYSNVKTSEYVGAGTYWPDYGPTTRESSGGGRNRPTEHIYERLVKPKASGKQVHELTVPQQQFRHPSPSREAVLREVEHTPEAKARARGLTEKQIVLRRLEMRQQKIDSWLEEGSNRPPIRALRLSDTVTGMTGSASDTSLSSSQASVVSRDVYARHGYLVGKSKGNIADGFGGLRPRKANSLSFQAMLFGKEVVNPTTSSRHSITTRKPGKQWRVFPENHYVFDAASSLPVLRGGDRNRGRGWPDLEHQPRQWSEPEAFAAHRTQPIGQAEAVQHRTAVAREAAAGQAGTSRPKKLAYGSQANPQVDTCTPWNAAATASSGGPSTQPQESM